MESGYTERRSGRTGTVVWRVRTEAPDHPVHPDGAMDLMWIAGALVIAGPDTRTAPAGVSGTVLGLRFPPGVATALLGLPAYELTDRRVPLTEIRTPPPPLPDGDPADLLEAVYQHLWARADPDIGDLRLAASLDRAARAGLGATGTAADHGMSARTLQRHSNRLFGYGYKQLAGIHRLRTGLALAREDVPLADAAHRAGYVDQSHFNREAKRITGTTPARLR
jgi:AraC-like DNA-binding protein